MGHPSVALMRKARLLMKDVALMTTLTTQHAKEKARILELDRSCCIARSLSACNASGAGQRGCRSRWNPAVASGGSSH